MTTRRATICPGSGGATAVALGYVSDAARVDKVKKPNFTDGSNCASCALHQGAAGSESGPCPLLTGKQVSAKDWCTSHVKKTPRDGCPVARRPAKRARSCSIMPLFRRYSSVG